MKLARALSACLLLASSACGPASSAATALDETEPDAEEPWAACDTHNPCSSDDFCDGSSLSQDDARCSQEESGKCVHTPIDDPTMECFPTAQVTVGHCVKGTCQ